jgi:hypothetical protein
MNAIAVVALFPGCTYFNVAPTVAVLSQFGRVLMAAPSRTPVTDSCGLTIVPHISYAEALAIDAKYVIVPGGDVAPLAGNPFFKDLVQHATQNKAWLSAIGSGVDSLRQFGLKGDMPSNENVLIGENFVAAQEWANIEFAMTLGILGGFLSPQMAAQKTDEYFGKPSRFAN